MQSRSRAALIRLSITDNFDMLTMVDWIENGVAPDEIGVIGNRVPASIGPYAGLLNTTRSRPLCAYPNILRATSRFGDISQRSSSMRASPERKHGHDRDDDNHDRDHSHH